MELEVAGVGEVDRDRALATLVMAFASDPFVRWIYPEPSQYLMHFPQLVQAFGGVAFAHGGVWRSGDFAAVALWLPPGVNPDSEATLAEFKASVDAARFDNLLVVLGQMDEAHPTARHWYLPWFGVDSAVQGRGIGSILMRPCLDIVDRDHLPAYLDSTNPRNISFYERHGFAVTGQWQSGDSPPMISMLRDPR